MGVIYIILGIIVGLLAAIVLVFMGAIVVLRFREEIGDFVEEVEEKVDTSQKAEIFAPTSPEVEAVEAVLKENDKRGRDTKIEELSDER